MRNSKLFRYAASRSSGNGDGFAGARQSEIGYYSTVNTFKPYLDKAIYESLYEGKGRDGGTLEDRTAKVYVWNTRPKNSKASAICSSASSVPASNPSPSTPRPAASARRPSNT